MMTNTCPPPLPPTFLMVNWRDCLQFSPSSMICYLPFTIEGACKVTVDHAFIRNIFVATRLYYVGVAIDELPGNLMLGTDTTHHRTVFLLRPEFFYTASEGDGLGGNGFSFMICPKDQWAFVPPSHSISKLTITLTDKYFKPLVWDQVFYPNGLNDYDFSLLLKIERC